MKRNLFRVLRSVKRAFSDAFFRDRSLQPLMLCEPFPSKFPKKLPVFPIQSDISWQYMLRNGSIPMMSQKKESYYEVVTSRPVIGPRIQEQGRVPIRSIHRVSVRRFIDTIPEVSSEENSDHFEDEDYFHEIQTTHSSGTFSVLSF